MNGQTKKVTDEDRMYIIKIKDGKIFISEKIDTTLKKSLIAWYLNYFEQSLNTTELPSFNALVTKLAE